MHKLPEDYSLDEKVEGILERNIQIKHSKSGGHGGQNVNKRETKAEGYIDIENSVFLTDEEKEKIKDQYHKHISKEGVLRVIEQEERFLERNVEKLKQKIKNLLVNALTEQKERKETSPSLAVLRKRQEDKKQTSKIKQQRKMSKIIDF